MSYRLKHDTDIYDLMCNNHKFSKYINPMQLFNDIVSRPRHIIFRMLHILLHTCDICHFATVTSSFRTCNIIILYHINNLSTT